ncbi:MAG: ABC transporter ATP-binding protein [Deferribacterales bacterium]
MSGKNKYLSILETYRQAQDISGDQAPAYRRSVRFFFLSFFAQGMTFVCFLPLMRALFSQPADTDSAWKWLGIMALFGLIDVSARWFGHDFDYTGNIVDVTHSLRMKLGRKIRSIALEKLFKYRTGDLNSVFSANVDESVLHIGVVGSLLIQIIVVPSLVIIAALLTDWRLGLAMLVIMPLGFPLYRWRRRASQEEKEEVVQAHADVESDIIEYTQGLPVLRAVNQTGVKSQRLQKSVKHLRKAQADGLMKGSLPALFITSLVEIGLLSVLILGGFFVHSGSLHIYVLAGLLIAVARFAEPISLYVNVTNVFDTVQSAFTRIRSLLDAKELDIIRSGSGPDGYDIEFSDVTFCYEGEKQPAVRNISFKIPYRSLTAIVGPSGSGKTTVTKLMMRYGDPSSGTVTLGGADIRSLEQAELMKYISVVFQDVYLFDDTIINNIRMGRPDATDDEVRAAADAAYCHEFISRLPEGYYTRTGDIGGSLSGGERQRISIARAILKNAPIVILDEPTAALDTESEEAVQKAVDVLVKDRTVIVIAHRLSTVKGADNILVIDEGSLAEQGTHHELMDKKGRYFDMWEAQQRAKNWNLASGGGDV